MAITCYLSKIEASYTLCSSGLLGESKLVQRKDCVWLPQMTVTLGFCSHSCTKGLFFS